MRVPGSRVDGVAVAVQAAEERVSVSGVHVVPLARGNFCQESSVEGHSCHLLKNSKVLRTGGDCGK